MKGISLISGVLFLAFLVAATAIVYTAGIPIIQNLQCSATLEKMKSSFTDIDEVIQEVSSEGKDSKRIITLNIDEGKLYVSGSNDTIHWTHECNAPIFSPRTSQAFGNVVMGSNMDTSAYEGQCKGQTAFILENEYLRSCFKKIGSPGNLVTYNTTDILLGIYQKDLDEWLPMEYLEISLDEDQSSTTGEGYTNLETSGYHLPYGEVKAYMESDYGVDYDIKFVLESGEDFLIIGGE
ncbi:MAG: hypothetical protein GTN39_03060 [Candidatus Aenigmarchaeota archaeon]|nr:hypothetical protein [Candidatus Aenigmarchaeota archaeon]